MFFLRLDLRGGWGRIPLGNVLIIGRSNTADVVLDGAKVSRLHCRLRLVGDVVTIEDLGSNTGTRLNGKKLTDITALALGDRLHVGPYSFMLEDEAGLKTGTHEPRAAAGPGLATEHTADDVLLPSDVPAATADAAREIFAPLAEAAGVVGGGPGLAALKTSDDVEAPLGEPPRGGGLAPQDTTLDAAPPTAVQAAGLVPHVTGEDTAPTGDWKRESVKPPLPETSTVIVDSALYPTPSEEERLAAEEGLPGDQDT